MLQIDRCITLCNGTARKTATEGDRGEDNKNPEWLTKQSIARQLRGGLHWVLHCATLKSR